MKIFATGDTHGNFERFRPEYFPEGRALTKEDVVLQLGDFGGVWFGDERDDEALDWLEGLPFTVAFVSGNHENYDALARYPVETWHGGAIGPDGAFLAEELRRSGVDTRLLRTDPDQSTGHAVIQVDGAGQNCILIYPGTNAALTLEEGEDLAAFYQELEEGLADRFGMEDFSQVDLQSPLTLPSGAAYDQVNTSMAASDSGETTLTLTGLFQGDALVQLGLSLAANENG